MALTTGTSLRCTGFALAAIAIPVFFRRAVVRPLGGLTAATQALSRGSADSEPPASSPEKVYAPLDESRPRSPVSSRSP